MRELSRPCAIIGGIAVGYRTELRFTLDLDLAVAVTDDQEAERLTHLLMNRGYTLFAQFEQAAANRLATVRLTTPTSQGIVCDLLFASSGIENEVVAGATVEELDEGLNASIASVGHLIALKLLSVSDRRAKDRADLNALRRVASEADRDVARHAVELITQRGYHREKDLLQDLETWWRTA